MIVDELARVIVPEGAPVEMWHEGRDEGTTASEIHAIAHGGRGRWNTVLKRKLNGSRFRGTKATRRGNEMESELVSFAATLDAVSGVMRSTAVLAHAVHDLDRATPDGFGIHRERGEFVVEAKWHEANWQRDDIPDEHLDQVQWQMWVSGMDLALYVWGQEGDSTFHVEWIERDNVRIARLAASAHEFQAWRAAGAPEIDDIPADVDDAIADYTRGLALERQAKKLKDDAKPRIEQWVASFGDSTVRKAGLQGSVTRVVEDVDVLDEDAWRAADPDTHAAYEEARLNATAATEAAEELLAAALKTYTKKQTKARPLAIRGLKEMKA